MARPLVLPVLQTRVPDTVPDKVPDTVTGRSDGAAIGTVRSRLSQARSIPIHQVPGRPIGSHPTTTAIIPSIAIDAFPSVALSFVALSFVALSFVALMGSLPAGCLACCSVQLAAVGPAASDTHWATRSFALRLRGF